MNFSSLGFKIDQILVLSVLLIVGAVLVVRDRWKKLGNPEEALKPILPFLQTAFCLVFAVFNFFRVDIYLHSWIWWVAGVQIVFYWFAFFIVTFLFYELIVKVIQGAGQLVELSLKNWIQQEAKVPSINEKES